MEYYIYVTKNCNLRCSYCSGINILKGSKRVSSRPLNLEENIERIKKDIKDSNHLENIVVFYGGEPLLNQSSVEEFISNISLSFPSIKYALYTNGTLLDQISQYLLNHLDYILISIDGDQKIHDKNRGKGTYDKILKNYLSVRTRFRGETIARLTITDESPLYEAVMGVIDKFDHVFWSLENTHHSPVNGAVEFYKENINVLADYWFKNIRDGIVKNIIPLQSITRSLLNNESHYNLRCGCGTYLKVEDIDGQFYICDELMGKEEYKINGTLNSDKYSHIKINNSCKACDDKFICGGRCFVALLYHPKKRFDIDCQKTRHLIKTMRDGLAIVQEGLNKKLIRKEAIETFASEHLTEEIP